MGVVTYLLRGLVARKHDFAIAVDPHICTYQDRLPLSLVAIFALDKCTFLGLY